MGNKKSAYRLAIVVGLALATIGAYAWAESGTHSASADALRYEKDRGCLTRPLSAAARRGADGSSSCRVRRLVVDRRDVRSGEGPAQVGAAASDAAAKPSGYVVTFADGPSRIPAELLTVPSPSLWATLAPGLALDVQFFDEKVSGFELAGRFVPTAGDPSVEPNEHAVGVAFIPLAFLYLFGIIAYFAIGPATPPKRPARKGGKPAKPAAKPSAPGPKPSARAAKR